MQDTFVMLSERGHDADWLSNLDLCQFEALAESSQRVDARRRLTEFSDGRQIAHGDKKVEAYLRPLKTASKIPMSVEKTADILMNAQQ